MIKWLQSETGGSFVLMINSAAHFLVDATCAAALFGGGVEALVPALLLYNTLAFSTQCLVGLLTDRIGRCKSISAAACLLVAAGFFLPLPPMAKAAAVGLGNSLFHVAAGTVTLERSGGKAWPLGVFVAPGSLGLALGTLYPGFGWLFAALLALCGAGIAFLKVPLPDKGSLEPAPRGGGLLAVLLLLAVAARALGGTAVDFPWKTGAALSVMTACYVLAGKAAGGFLCDRLGAGRTVLFSLPAAALLIAFGAESMGLSLLGQFLLNLTMPVTLLLIYRCLPKEPGFAFGLAASALWPGTLAGQLIGNAGSLAPLWIIGSFIMGLAAILLAAKGEKVEKVS